MLVAAAGPASNLLLAFVAALALSLLPVSPMTLGEPNVSAPLAALLAGAIQLNVLLAVFNMLPIPPLDGGNVLVGLLPHDAGASAQRHPTVRVLVALRADAHRRLRLSRRPAVPTVLFLAADTVSSSKRARVVSGMRPTGRLHLGHLVGALGNWVPLQEQYDCFYFVADWHALTSDFADTSQLTSYAYDNVADWIGAGLDPEKSTFFIQSLVPEHAELYLLLSMVVPVPWLERVPTYKEQQENLKDKDLSSIGFLGYPLLQTADVAMYDAQFVPVGEDQVAHLELAREVVRRFNNFFGDVLVGAAAAAHDVSPSAGSRRRQEDEQEPGQHDPPVGQRRRGEQEGHADVHRPEARARRHSRHGRRQSGVHVPRRVQSEHGGSRRPQRRGTAPARSATSR